MTCDSVTVDVVSSDDGYKSWATVLPQAQYPHGGSGVYR